MPATNYSPALYPKNQTQRSLHIRNVNPPAPVERVDGSPQLGLPSEALIKAEGFWGCLFLGMVCWVSSSVLFEFAKMSVFAIFTVSAFDG